VLRDSAGTVGGCSGGAVILVCAAAATVATARRQAAPEFRMVWKMVWPWSVPLM
jgi:predicted acylesterase/phospholipase RssA